ncbi:MAG: hypothetical protein SFX73_35665 [Kofleriaceae bacterium]|nr:hypothetical protein [Kofleriaceae bacterium]
MERIEGWLARRRLHRQIRAAPMLAFAEVTEGDVVRITGRVATLDKQTLEAPFSGKPCVYYSVTTVFVGGARPQVLASHHNAVPFLLANGDHRAVIDLTHAQLSVTIRHRTKTSATHFLAGRTLSGYLERREAVIAAHDALVLVGTGIAEPDPERPPSELYRGLTAHRFRFVGAAEDPLLVSDEPALFSTE